MFEQFLGVAPWAILSAIASWIAAAYLNYEKRKDQRVERGDKLEIHRDELTFELLQGARSEMASARLEVEDLRSEVKKLRSMESHFYHFQQSIDHLEAILFPENDEVLKVAEKNARAFVNRMRRLQEAKGVIANETQRAASSVSEAERDIGKEPN